MLVSECLKWPGFVEFDDANGRAMTYNAQTRSVPPPPGDAVAPRSSSLPRLPCASLTSLRRCCCPFLFRRISPLQPAVFPPPSASPRPLSPHPQDLPVQGLQDL